MKITHRKIEVPLFPKQLEFLYSTAKETLFSGGVRSGKTHALCYALLMQASIPNNEVILLRKTYKSLKLSTLVTLLQGTGDAPPIIPRGSYKLNKVEGTIKINGGGTIYCLGMSDQPTRIRSINAGCICVDEAIELSEQEYNELLLRLSNKRGNRKIFLATNPDTPSHFLYNRFFRENNVHRKVITISSYENTTLPEDYVDTTLGDLDEQRKRRFVLGEWCAFDNLVYNNFNRDIHVRHIDKNEPFEEYYLAIDYGQTHPSAIVLVGKTRDRLVVIEEYCKQDPSIDKLREVIKGYYDKYAGNITCLYDPSAKIIANDLSNIGITLIKANNDVSVGIARVRTKLNVRNDSPDLIINDSCVNLIREFSSYQYKTDSEVVRKVNDDCLDGVRYIINYIEDEKGQLIYPSVNGESENDLQEKEEEWIEFQEQQYSSNE